MTIKSFFSEASTSIELISSNVTSILWFDKLKRSTISDDKEDWLQSDSLNTSALFSEVLDELVRLIVGIMILTLLSDVAKSKFYAIGFGCVLTAKVLKATGFRCQMCSTWEYGLDSGAPLHAMTNCLLSYKQRQNVCYLRAWLWLRKTLKHVKAEKTFPKSKVDAWFDIANRNKTEVLSQFYLWNRLKIFNGGICSCRVIFWLRRWALELAHYFLSLRESLKSTKKGRCRWRLTKWSDHGDFVLDVNFSMAYQEVKQFRDRRFTTTIGIHHLTLISWIHSLCCFRTYAS